MNEDRLCGRWNWIGLATVLSLAMLTSVGCVDRNSRYDVAYAGQGAVVLKENPNPTKPPQVVETHPAPPVEMRVAPPAETRPSEKEMAMQRRIDELEAQSLELKRQLKDLEAAQKEIPRLNAALREYEAEIVRLKQQK